MSARIARLSLLASLLVACAGAPGDDAGQATSQFGEGTNCAEVGSRHRQRLKALGCDDDVAHVEAHCETIFAGARCLSEWETLSGCLQSRPERDFQCDENNELEARPGVCANESAALEECRF